MIVRVINVFVKEDRVEDFSVATRKNRQGSVQEPGVLRFDVLQDSTDPTHFILYEAYRSEEAATQHKQMSHYAEWKTDVESMMARPRKSTACTVIAPRGQENW